MQSTTFRPLRVPYDDDPSLDNLCDKRHFAGTILQESTEPEPSEHSVTGIAVLVIAIAAKLLMSRFFRKNGESTGSEELKVSSRDALFVAVITTATLISVIVSMPFGNIALWLYGVLGIFIAKWRHQDAHSST